MEYVAAGFGEVQGFDVVDYLQVADDERPRFKFGRSLPWDDASFNFVFATQVFEHIPNPEEVYRDIYRVLKPGGCFLNVFPSKWRPIEPHTGVPFAGVFAPDAYLRLCARLGIRMTQQRGLPSDMVAAKNRTQLAEQLHYLSGREIDEMLSNIFDDYEYVEDTFIEKGPGRSRYLSVPARIVPPFRLLYRFAHTRALLLRKS